MWNRSTLEHINSFEQFIGMYKLCKSRGTDEERLEGNRQAYAALRAAEVGDEQLFKQAWRDLKRFSHKSRPHTDRMFFDYVFFTCRSWTDLVLCNLYGDRASLAYKWIDEEMDSIDEGSTNHVVRTWRRSRNDKVIWRLITAEIMFEHRGPRALMFPDSDPDVKIIIDHVDWFRAWCYAMLPTVEARHLASILHVERVEHRRMPAASNIGKNVAAVRRL